MEEKQKRFIEQYTALIAQLNRKHQSLLWWATDISSKNHYTCLLPEYVQDFKSVLPFEERPWSVRLQRYKKIAALFVFALRMYARALLARWKLGALVRARLKSGQKFYVIKTFGYDSSFDEIGRYRDAFFGRLAEDIGPQKNVLLFVNVLGNFPQFLNRAAGEGPLLVPLELFLRWQDVWTAVRDVLKFQVNIEGPVVFEGTDVAALVRYELYRNFNGIQVSQLLHYHCTCRLLQQCQVETFLMTYENNPWERMCTLALRTHSPLTKIIGYQHAVVPYAALNMFLHPLDHGVVPLPDRIITVGEVTAQLLKEAGNYPPGMVQCGAALRYEHLHRSHAQPPAWRGHVLVILDGVRQSAQLLEYALVQLQDQPGLQVVLRAHPALPPSYWQKTFGPRIEGAKNVRWSQESLNEDLQWADAVVYWQSTVAWEALAQGRGVVNFASMDILSYDPLLGCSFLRWSVNAGDSLVKVLQEIRALPGPTRQQQSQKARDFIGKYFYPVSQQGVELFL